MTVPKGAGLEELVRAYFARQQFIAIRGVKIRFEDEDVTDVDVWVYGRQGAGARTRSVVDVKDKRSPRAFERIMWTRGLQLALGCDRAIVATTDSSLKVSRFANQQRVGLLTAEYLRRSLAENDTLDRLSAEEFAANLRLYPDHKIDGDWIKLIEDAKSAVVSLQPFPAFIRATGAFRHFAEKAATRPLYREQALRASYYCASMACISLDSALEKVYFSDQQAKYGALKSGITYGDAGDKRVQSSIETVLNVISRGVNNGAVIARQTSDALHDIFESVRAEIVAEYFSKDHNANVLFGVARELEARAHARTISDILNISTEARSVLGLLADFVQVKRPPLLRAEVDRTEIVPTTTSGHSETDPDRGGSPTPDHPKLL